MSKLIAAIEHANALLIQTGLPRYDEVVELLQAAESKFETIQRYHSHDVTAESIASFREKINLTLQNFPYP